MVSTTNQQPTTNNQQPTTIIKSFNYQNTTIKSLNEQTTQNVLKFNFETYRDDITPIKEDYDRKWFYEYRDPHGENGEHGTPSIKPYADLNKNYDEFSERKRNQWDINQNQRFYLAQIISRFGFLSKSKSLEHKTNFGSYPHILNISFKNAPYQ
ncbi:hypothetical protein ACTA71_002934 [Dictyostelium dimigraforme]